ncbi:MAG TPA: hypothetical protein VFB36_04545 [Nevskiaceae bacterium]|nr:hypothetical protein [Nevskiaceae bacterium]
MKSSIAVCLVLLGSACASTGRPGEATRTARDTVASCAPGYVEDAFSGTCEPYNGVQQRQAGPIRQTLGGAMAQPGLLRR